MTNVIPDTSCFLQKILTAICFGKLSSISCALFSETLAVVEVGRCVLQCLTTKGTGGGYTVSFIYYYSLKRDIKVCFNNVCISHSYTSCNIY